jgi:hypothetical protein
MSNDASNDQDPPPHRRGDLPSPSSKPIPLEKYPIRMDYLFGRTRHAVYKDLSDEYPGSAFIWMSGADSE